MTSPDDAVLARITYDPGHTELSLIPWPDGLAPAAAETAPGPGGSLPPADVLVITWTAAEARALADVLTPGAPSAGWVHYDRDFDSYAPALTFRSPAREARRLGEFQLCRIAGMTVCCFHSQLHPATDSASLPAARLAAQAAAETGARLVITTGTAGGVGEGVTLGDVNIAVSSSSLFSTRLKSQPWSRQTWPAAPLTDGQKAMLAPGVIAPLFEANAGRLPAEWAPRLPQVWHGDSVSTDFFAIGDLTDHYGLTAYRPGCRDVDMDDAAVCYGLSQMGNPPAVAVVRNASDPTMPGASPEDLRLAEQIYQQHGYVTTSFSAIACWALAAGLAQD